MLKIERVVAASLVGMVVSGAAAQDAVQWRVEDCGNGHWNAISAGYGGWQSSRDAALATGGDLAALSEEEEWRWVRDWLPSNLHGYWLGGRQEPGGNTPEYGWFWLDGEPVDPVWMVMDGHPRRASDPDVADVQQDFLHTCCESCPHGVSLNGLADLGGWGCDIGLESLIEWSADCSGDDIVDYCQILGGINPNEDGNSVPDCCDGGAGCGCPAGIAGDRQVGAADLGVLLVVWGTEGGAFPTQASTATAR